MALPTLTPNKIFNALSNMIISQIVLADNISNSHVSLADKSRVDGSMYGDSKVWYSSDVLRSYEWNGDAEAANLLKLHRPEAPEVQTITIDQFRIIPVTVDNYLTKQAWSTENAFSSFNSQMLSWMKETKRIFDATIFNTFVGTHSTDIGKQDMTISLPAEPDSADDYNIEAYNRLVAQIIAQSMADLLIDINDVSRSYNDYGNLRSFEPNDMVFVWNSEWVNKIKKLDTPTIFHKDGLIDKFAENVLPARYFGNVNTSGGTTTGTNITVRSLIEKDYNTVEPNQAGYDPAKHIFAGDLLPGNTAYNANETYTEDKNIVFKAYHKDSIPFMTGFQSGTAFFNPRSLTETHYLIWGYNTLESLKNYPFITAKAQVAG